MPAKLFFYEFGGPRVSYAKALENFAPELSRSRTIIGEVNHLGMG